ncbi:hypothetical protein C5E02_00015 [Rathayibacter rathayi]|uniref:Uncharacterized protein n=1 Tax=Rathayibacter rathayi TaxID=33887 RepID=A0ABD6W5U1_RATRA|nr:hypothetical protein C1O28_00100 [Rathayibacter rathayi]PPF10270.1 hypothetical protein C5C04_13465 [Rathayibacter rathayi]PPF44308.1 hypothetical protein C5C08_13340 [Rathayibacter rathayi]PPG65271.1 hypothetical protein C5C16_13465 [Rathayibacter rathayi]PPG74631.1 hypothetical protein C5C15_14285 [Rathayibacter rathayi]
MLAVGRARRRSCSPSVVLAVGRRRRTASVRPRRQRRTSSATRAPDRSSPRLRSPRKSDPAAARHAVRMGTDASDADARSFDVPNLRPCDKTVFPSPLIAHRFLAE